MNPKNNHSFNIKEFKQMNKKSIFAYFLILIISISGILIPAILSSFSKRANCDEIFESFLPILKYCLIEYTFIVVISFSILYFFRIKYFFILFLQLITCSLFLIYMYSFIQRTCG